MKITIYNKQDNKLGKKRSYTGRASANVMQFAPCNLQCVELHTQVKQTDMST